MLETFAWTDGSIFTSDEAEVVTAQRGRWNLLEQFKSPGCVFGYVLDGENSFIRRNRVNFGLLPGSYFVTAKANTQLFSPGGRILLINAVGRDFPFMVGGPIEPRGRLKYIDGCTDSLVIPPWRMGEPCLNHLHIPAWTEQTMHTHPSDRIGTIVRGFGHCVTPEGITELLPGMVWRIPANGLHRFRTEDMSLDIIAWHPDSDFGPTDDDHPMLNRSMVNGVSAAELDAIRTR